MEDMNSCEKLSIIAQLLAFSADRCTLKPPTITNYDKEITKNTRYFDKKLKFTKKIVENKRIRILGDYYLLSRTQLVEAGLAHSTLEKLDQYSKRIQSQKAECLFINKLLRAKRIKEFNVRVEKAIASGNLKVFSKLIKNKEIQRNSMPCLLYTSPSPRDATLSRMPSSA